MRIPLNGARLKCQKTAKMLTDSRPRETLSVIDATAIIVGVVVGVGIFKTPSLVAAEAGSEWMLIALWIAGGLISLAGALCYAELASSYPHAGGDYYYLRLAFGSGLSFLFAWARMVVIQSGSIAMVAFLIGDYASELLRLGKYSSAFYAAAIIVILTGINMAGIHQGRWTQRVLTAVIVFGLMMFAVISLFLAEPPSMPPAVRDVSGNSTVGMAMIFVLLTYGGWSESSFLSAEVRKAPENMVKVLLYSIGSVAVIYLLVNLALVRNMGLSEMAGSATVMADLARRLWGESGANFISLLILIAALSTMNGAIITGARTNYALGGDYYLLRFLGRWQGRRHTPVNSLLAQGALSLGLVFLGMFARDGFVLMVEYTAPVFWLFMLFVGVALFILRQRNPDCPRPFFVPLYPLLPLIFCLACIYMLYSSLVYTGYGSLVGVGTLLTGVPVYLWQIKYMKTKITR